MDSPRGAEGRRNGRESVKPGKQILADLLPRIPFPPGPKPCAFIDQYLYVTCWHTACVSVFRRHVDVPAADAVCCQEMVHGSTVSSVRGGSSPLDRHRRRLAPWPPESGRRALPGLVWGAAR